MSKKNLIKAIPEYIFLLFMLMLVFIIEPAFSVEYYMKADVTTKTMPDGAVITMWGFALCNSTFTSCDPVTIPGPMLIVPPGDSTLTIHLKNNLTPATVGGTGSPVSIIIPGQITLMTPVRFGPAPYPEYEGRVRSFTQETPPDNTTIVDYSWNDFKPGTYIYQSGTHPQHHIQMGLYGAVKKDAGPQEAYPDVFYDNEIILFYSEIDPAFHQAVATNNYGPGKDITSTINYKPKYFLINGQPYPAAFPIIDHPLGSNEQVLIRFLNAGLKTHVPCFRSIYMSLIAEDGNIYPYPKEQYSVLLPAGKTIDALLSPPAGTLPIYDRRLYLTNAEVSPGGMLTYLTITQGPSAQEDSYSTNEEIPLSVPQPGVLGNDFDPDSNPLTAILVSTATHGILNLNSNGSFNYVPNLNFNGTDSFLYKANNGTENTNMALVTLTITPVNDAPIAVNDTGITPENSPVVVNVLANDIDIDLEPLTVSGVTNGAHGLTSINADQTVTYTPNPNFKGEDSFNYTAFDGMANSNTATVTITVTPGNIPPVAQNDSASTTRNTPVVINVIANDFDPDGTIVPATVTIVTPPTQKGTAVSNGNGTITFTPKKNFARTDTFTYTVKDNDGAVSNLATVSVKVSR